MRTVSCSSRVLSLRKHILRSPHERKNARFDRLPLPSRFFFSLAPLLPRSSASKEETSINCSTFSTAPKTQPQVAPARRSVSVRAAVKQVRHGGVGLGSRGRQVRRAEVRMALDLSLPRERTSLFLLKLIRQARGPVVFELFPCVSACHRTVSRSLLLSPSRRRRGNARSVSETCRIRHSKVETRRGRRRRQRLFFFRLEGKSLRLLLFLWLTPRSSPRSSSSFPL